MVLKLFPALVSIIFVLTIYRLEWVPRRERRCDAAAKDGKWDRETGTLGCNIT